MLQSLLKCGKGNNLPTDKNGLKRLSEITVNNARRARDDVNVIVMHTNDTIHVR